LFDKIFFRYKKNELPSILDIAINQKQTLFYPMTESTQKAGGPPVVLAALSELAALKNVDGLGHGGSDSNSNRTDGDSSTTNNYGDVDDNDNEEDNFPVYGYGRDTMSGDDKGDDFGYGDDKDVGSPADDYGYGYGKEAAPFQPSLLDAVLRVRPRRMRRNSCVIRKDQDPLAVAESLLDGPPRMSDRDMELPKNEIARSA
jgi:hypothetical protein